MSDDPEWTPNWGWVGARIYARPLGLGGSQGASCPVIAFFVFAFFVFYRTSQRIGTMRSATIPPLSSTVFMPIVTGKQTLWQQMRLPTGTFVWSPGFVPPGLFAAFVFAGWFSLPLLLFAHAPPHTIIRFCLGTVAANSFAQYETDINK